MSKRSPITLFTLASVALALLITGSMQAGERAGDTSMSDQLFRLEKACADGAAGSPYSVGITVNTKGALEFRPNTIVNVRESSYGGMNNSIPSGFNAREQGSVGFHLSSADIHSVHAAGAIPVKRIRTVPGNKVSCDKTFCDKSEGSVFTTATLGILGLAGFGLSRIRRRRTKQIRKQIKKAQESVHVRVPLVTFRSHPIVIEWVVAE